MAAVGATGALINLIVNLFIGLSVGAGVAVAQALGANDHEKVFRVIHTAIPVALVAGAILTVVGIIGSEQFLMWMETPEDVLPLSAVYMRIYFYGMISSMVYNFGAAILRAAGDTKSPLSFLTIAGITNIVLNLFFVVVCKMDVAGVALATSISQTISALLILIALTKRTDGCRLHLKKLHFYKDAFGQMVRIGLPAGLQGSLFSISNVIIQSSVNSFGSVVMSGSSAGANIEGFVYISMNAFYQTALNFIGQNVGARKIERVKRVLGLTLLLVGICGFCLGTLACIFANPLLSIYLPNSTEAVQYGILRMTYVCGLYFICGLMDVMTGTMRGMGASVTPLITAVLGVCGFRIVWLYTIFQMEEYHTLESLFISYPISWLGTLLVQIVAYLIIFRNWKRKIRGESA